MARAVEIWLATAVVFGKAETVVCRAVRSLLSAFRANDVLTVEVLARPEIALVTFALWAAAVSYGTSAVVI